MDYQEVSEYGVLRVDPYTKAVSKPRKSVSGAIEDVVSVAGPLVSEKRKSLPVIGDTSAKKIKNE